MKISFYRFISALGLALLIGCGGGSGSESDTDENKEETIEDSTLADETPLITQLTKPLINTEGAEAGLRGCINRPLYFNGPHTVSFTQTEGLRQPYWETTFDSTFETEIRYEALKVNDDGTSEVAVVKTTTKSASGNAISVAYTEILDGYNIYETVVGTAIPDDSVYVEYFNIEEGESVPQTINIRTEAEPLFETRIDEYIGREDITVAGNLFKACRVDSLFTVDDELPQFRRRLVQSAWYGVGTGLLLLKEAVNYPDSPQDELISSTVMTSAQINGTKIF